MAPKASAEGSSRACAVRKMRSCQASPAAGRSLGRGIGQGGQIGALAIVERGCLGRRAIGSDLHPVTVGRELGQP